MFLKKLVATTKQPYFREYGVAYAYYLVNKSYWKYSITRITLIGVLLYYVVIPSNTTFEEVITPTMEFIEEPTAVKELPKKSLDSTKIKKNPIPKEPQAPKVKINKGNRKYDHIGTLSFIMNGESDMFIAKYFNNNMNLYNEYKTEKLELIDAFVAKAVKSAKTAGLDTTIYNPVNVITQSLLESNVNDSKLAVKYHNYLGHTCNGCHSVKANDKNGKGKVITQNFRIYTSMTDCFVGHRKHFINKGRYYNRLKNAKTATAQFKAIKAGGYAEDPNYVKKCVKLHTFIAKRYDIYKHFPKWKTYNK